MSIEFPINVNMEVEESQMAFNMAVDEDINVTVIQGTDVSDTTAVESDVLEGKKFHKANGDLATGTLVLPPDPVLDDSIYLLRALPYTSYLKQLQKIIGGTVAWNQLANNGSASVTSGHKYISCSSDTWSIGTSNGTAISADIVFDITLMFGSTIADYIYGLGSASCVAWFRNLFPSASYPYDAGSLLSVKTSASTMVGANLLDSTNIFQGNFENYGQAYTYNVVTGFIRVLPNTRYYERKRFQTSGCYVRLYKADKTTYTSINKYVSSDFDFTTDADTAYVRLMWYREPGITPSDVINADCCLNVYDASINGTYQPYCVGSYAFDSSVELRGLLKLDTQNNLFYDGDEYVTSGTVTRKYEYRAYQIGDESLANAITDGTHTVVKLSTPTTENATPYIEHQACFPNGTERFVDGRNVEMPVEAVTEYVL